MLAPHDTILPANEDAFRNVEDSWWQVWSFLSFGRWMALFLVIKFVRHDAALRRTLYLWTKHFVANYGCPVSKWAFDRWIESSSSSQKCIPSDCCPKRRARWEKTWRKKSCRQKDRCLFRQLFCCTLPPPLPLRDDEKPGDDTTTVQNASTLPQDTTVEQQATFSPEDEGSRSSHDSSSSHEEDTTIPRSITPRPPQVQLIDLVRMQQWQTLINQKKWKRRQVKFRDTDGLYPLHWAAAGGSPLAVVERLLTVAPRIAQMPDSEGSLPLHFAAHYSASRDVIGVIWKAYPDAIQHQDRYGRTPLYHAVDKSLSLLTFQMLMLRQDQSISYELITTPCFTPQGSSEREQATRTPLYMIWASVLNDRETRSKLRGKTWDKAIWMLQQSHRYHYDTYERSLLSLCIRMDLYLPEPIIPLIAQHVHPPQPSDLTLAASTASYSLTRIVYLLKYLFTIRQDETGTVALAAARAGQPWEVLELLPHRDRYDLAVLSAVATPIVYKDTSSSFQQDPFGLLRRVWNEKETSILKKANTVPSPTTISPVETVYRLLRENPGQLRSSSD